MAPDKTRGTLSKGAYIYETFGKQMDKSNITEAERDQAPWERPTVLDPPLSNGFGVTFGLTSFASMEYRL